MDLNRIRDQRPYSVLTRDGLKAKVEKLIGDIAEVFLISISDTTVLLMHTRWNGNLVEERLVDGKEKLLVESGLMKSNVMELSSDFHKIGMSENYGVDDSKRDLVCGACLRDSEEIQDGDELVSTPICSHKFCTTCWRMYLNVCSDKNQMLITCPDIACKAAVGPVTIEKLTVRDQEMYQRMVLRSYVEENMDVNIKKCPNCENVIVFDNLHQMSDEYGLNVVCLCGYTFCWQCKLEAHRPVTCNNAADWFRDLKNFNDSLTQSWMDSNTKPCPSCLCPVQLDRDIHGIRPMLTCACSVTFCWKCLKTEEEHIKEVGQFGSCVAVEQETEKMIAEVAKICVDRWEAYQATVNEAKRDLKDFDNYLIIKQQSSSVLSEEDIRMSREGLMLIIQCRLVLKWSCVYDHYHTEYENSKKEYLWFLQEHACSTLTGYLKTFLEETEKAFKATTDQELVGFRLILTTATSNIGNYFYHFIKTLNEGLVDVKVKSYNGVAGPYWFCDRCTFGNDWIHKHCQMCVDPNASTCEEILSD